MVLVHPEAAAQFIATCGTCPPGPAKGSAVTMHDGRYIVAFVMGGAMPFHRQILLPGLLLSLGYDLEDIESSGLMIALIYVAWVLSEQNLPLEIWRLGVLVASGVLVAHALPGFSPHPLSGLLQYSPDAAPVVLRLSWGKALVGLTLLMWWLGTVRRCARVNESGLYRGRNSCRSWIWRGM
jgi:hypothetical protein